MEFIIGEDFFIQHNITENEKQHEYSFTVTDDMIIDGESRVSCLTIIKIVEAIRDVFWKKYFSGEDSVCKRIETRFVYPIIIGAVVQVRLYVIYFTERSICFGFHFYIQGRVVALTEMELTVVDSYTLSSKNVSTEMIKVLKQYMLKNNNY